MILSISEILDKTSKLKSFEDKVEFLHRNTTPALIWILKVAFHPDIKWLLPPGTPPYRPSDFHDVHGVLRRDYRKLQYFVSNQGYDNLRPLKRETMFVEFLESIDREDAKLLLALKDGKMPYKTVTYRLAETAFPGLLPSRNSDKKNEQPEEK